MMAAIKFVALRDIVVDGKGVRAGETFDADWDQLHQAVVKGYAVEAPDEPKPKRTKAVREGHKR